MKHHVLRPFGYKINSSPKLKYSAYCGRVATVAYVKGEYVSMDDGKTAIDAATICNNCRRLVASHRFPYKKPLVRRLVV